MLYLAIPAHDEAATIGVLLWRLRTVLAEFPREYEAVVYDDASTDSTPEILESYARVMPLTVLRGERRVGYAGAVDALVRHVARHTRYPRRDAVLLLQGDFTDAPSLVPEFIKRFEGGTDVVVGERDAAARRKAPVALRGLMRAEPWLTRFFVRADGIRDITSSYRLIRISVLRDLLRAVGDSPVCAGDTRTANADLLLRLVPLARRVEGIPVEPTWQLRQRESRILPVSDAISLLKWAWSARGRRVAPSTAPDSATDAGRPTRSREGRAELRLEGRSDGGTEVSVSSSESVRTSGGRTSSARTSTLREPAAGRTRSARPPRGEPKPERTADAASTTRGEARSPSGARKEPRSGTRKERAVDRPLVLDSTSVDDPIDTTAAGTLVSQAISSDAISSDANGEDAVNERPPRRKRSRSRRSRTVEGTAAAGIDGSESATDGTQLDSNDSNPDADAVDVPASRPELSASISEAIANAEQELDVGTHQRSLRKKRRRRGSRGGRVDGAGEDSVQENDDRAEAVESGNGSEAAVTHSPATDSPITDSRVAHRQRSRAAHDVDEADTDDAGTSDEGDGNQDGASGDAGDASDSEPRRRGRRGRRGGARRKRSAGESSEASEIGDTAADVAPAPHSAPHTSLPQSAPLSDD